MVFGDFTELPSAARHRTGFAPRLDQRASSTLRFWLPLGTCSSRALSWGSPKISHQGPRRTWSLGCAAFQPSASLYAGVSGTSGVLYLGPTVQPASKARQNRGEC